MPYRRDYESLSSEEALRRVRELDLHCTTSLYSPPKHDPLFTPLFLGVFGPAGLGFSAATAAALAPIASAIAVTSVTAGIMGVK